MNAMRRHHRARLRKRRLAYRWLDSQCVGKFIDTPHPCSRPCCGNPRRHCGGPTMQERRAFAQKNWQ